jgi:hypothetical protein
VRLDGTEEVGDGTGVGIGVSLAAGPGVSVPVGVVVPVAPGVPLDVAVPAAVVVPVAFGVDVPPGVADVVGDAAAVVVGRPAVGVEVPDCCSDRAVGECAEAPRGRALSPARARGRRTIPALTVKDRAILLLAGPIWSVPCYHGLRVLFTIYLQTSDERNLIPCITIGRYHAYHIGNYERSWRHG